MKCIHCDTDNNLQDRTNNQGRCKNCNHPFAFEPKSMDIKTQIADPFFARVLNDVSANGTLYFTPRQFFYLLEKRLNKKWNPAHPLTVLGCIVAFVSLLFIGQASYMLFGFGLGIVLSIVGWLQSRQKSKPRRSLLTPEMTREWLQRWSQVHSMPEKLLQQPGKASSQENSSAPAEIQPDVTAYSFDRLVVCDSDAIVQMLVANNFHSENSCAVLGITGYPQGIFDTVMEMLRRNPDLQVLALHNCSAKGMKFARQLRTDSNWFAGSNVTIVDIGLLPRQVLVAKRDIFVRVSSKSARETVSLPAEVRHGLSAEELKWLEAGNVVELESFGPGQLMRVLSRSVAKSREFGIAASDGDVGFIAIDDSSSDRLIYVASSFG